jgi:hydrogenase maturation protease
MSILVLGLGNPLLGDDGAGLVALEQLEQAMGPQGGLEFVDGGTQGVYLLPYLENREKLLILDAVDFGERPGQVGTFDPMCIPLGVGPKLSPHQAGFEEVLGLLELLGHVPKESVLLGVQPKSLRLGDPLSEEVRLGLSKVLEKAIGVLQGWLMEGL